MRIPILIHCNLFSGGEQFYLKEKICGNLVKLAHNADFRSPDPGFGSTDPLPVQPRNALLQKNAPEKMQNRVYRSNCTKNGANKIVALATISVKYGHFGC